MSTELVKKEETSNEKLAKVYGFQPEEIGVIKNTVAKNTSNTELALFLSICSGSKLNPFLKQIWCYKDNKDNLLVFAGRDGYLEIAQRSPLWNGMTSFAVYSNDEFLCNIFEGQVKLVPNFKDRGKLLGAVCYIKPKGCEQATIEWADINTYDKKQYVWNSHKDSQIMKVAEVHALKKAFGISGLQCEEDFIIRDNKAITLSEKPLMKEEQVLTRVDFTSLLAEIEMFIGSNYSDSKSLSAESLMVLNGLVKKYNLNTHEKNEVSKLIQLIYDGFLKREVEVPNA